MKTETITLSDGFVSVDGEFNSNGIEVTVTFCSSILNINGFYGKAVVVPRQILCNLSCVFACCYRNENRKAKTKHHVRSEPVVHGSWVLHIHEYSDETLDCTDITVAN